MYRDPQIAVERRKPFHQPVEREAPEVRVPNPREIRSGETGQRGGLADRQTAVVEHPDDAGRHHRLDLLQVRVGIAQVAENVAAALNQLEFALAHGIVSLLSRASRPRTRSISVFGVPIPVFDFFRNAWITQFHLLLLTGCRLSEIQILHWEYVKEDCIELPDAKTGGRVVPLGPEARAVLAALPREEDNPWVIVGRLPGSHITDLQRPWRRIRARAGLEDVRIHDLRHSYASRALALGESLTMIGKLLGHTQVQTTARYAHLARDSIQNAAARITGSIGGNLSPLSDIDKTTGH